MKANLIRFLAMLMCLAMIAAMPLAAWAEEGADPANEAGAADTQGDPADGAAGDDDSTEDEDSSADDADMSPYAEDVTKKLKINLSEGKPNALADRKPGTTWSNAKENARITLTIPASRSVEALYILWEKIPSAFRFFEYDGDGKAVFSGDQRDFTLSYEMLFEIHENTRQIILEFPKRGESIMELYVYYQGELPPTVHDWVYASEDEKVDMLFMLAHMGDEYLYMGGAIPYYTAVRGKTFQVAFLANEERRIKHEGLEALWGVGQRLYPSLANFSNKRVKTMEEALKNWNEQSMLSGMVTQIRRYKPEVVLSNAAAGEGGHGTRAATAKVVQQAVLDAADASKFPESYEKYGAWQVKKLYLHLGEENAITMNWQTAYDELNGQTPLRVATDAYAKYSGISTEMTGTDDGDYTKFSLVYSNVGDDIAKDDFFENIDGDVPALSDTPTIDPSTIPAGLDAFDPPTTTPTPEPSPDPTTEPTATPVPQGFGIRDNLEPLKVFGIALAVAIGATAIGLGLKVFLGNRGGAAKKKKKSRSGSSRASSSSRKRSASSSGGKKTAGRKPSSSDSTKKKPPSGDETY